MNSLDKYYAKGNAKVKPLSKTAVHHKHYELIFYVSNSFYVLPIPNGSFWFSFLFLIVHLWMLFKSDCKRTPTAINHLVIWYEINLIPLQVNESTMRINL